MPSHSDILANLVREVFATLLARETDAVYEECVKAFKGMHYIRGMTIDSLSPIQQFIEAVRSEILDKDIAQDLSPCLIEDAGSRRPLREFLFHGSAGDVLTNQPVLDLLYEILVQKNLAHRHEWKKNDLMLIDNRGTTLHARAPSAHPAKITTGGEDFRRHFSWNENCRNMFYLESGD